MSNEQKNRVETVQVGIVVERRDSSHPWADHVWMPVACLTGAKPMDPHGDWRKLDQGEGWSRWLAGTLTIELHRTETEGYRYNLSGRRPALYVVMRETDDSRHERVPLIATVSPYEAEAYLEGDDIVTAVPLPPELEAWMQGFIDAHHVDRPFNKRRRDRAIVEPAPEFPLPPTVRRGSHGR